MSRKKKKYTPKSPNNNSKHTSETQKKEKGKNILNNILYQTSALGVFTFILLLWALPEAIELRKLKVNIGLFNVIASILTGISALTFFKQTLLFYRIQTILFSLSIALWGGLSLSLNLNELKEYQNFFLAFKVFGGTTILVLGLPLVLSKNPNPINTSDNTTSHKLKQYLIWGTLLLVVIGGTGLFLFENDHFDLFDDEFQMVSTGKGFQETNDNIQWDFVENKPSSSYYHSAYPHTVLLGTSFKIFGYSIDTARDLSAILGGLFLATFFFVGNFFIRKPSLVLFTLVILIFCLNYLHLFRYIRMYALMIPLAQIAFILLYKTIEESKILSAWQNHKVFQWANFNYLSMLIAFPLLYINYRTHQVSLAIAAGTVVYFILATIIFRERKHILGLGVIALLVIWIAVYKPSFFPFHVLSFFQNRDYDYFGWLTGFPFYYEMTFAILLLGAILFFSTKNKPIIKRYLFVVSLIIFSLVFFTFIAQYSGHGFRFISHVAPWVILLSIVSLYYIFKQQLNSFIVWGLLLVLVLPRVFILFSSNYAKIFEYDPIRPQYSKVYNKLDNLFDYKNDVLYAIYFRRYYGASMLKKGVDVIGMKKQKKYTIEEFTSDLTKRNSGWVVWATQKTWHLHDNVRSYINQNFKHISGKQIDSSGIEVYYFNREMLPGSVEFNEKAKDKFPINAWLNSKKEFTAVVKIKPNNSNGQAPLVFDKNDSLFFNLEFSETSTNDEINLNWKIKKTDNSFSNININLAPKQTFDLVMHWHPNQKQTTATVYYFGKKQNELKLKNVANGEQRVFLPKFFPGSITSVAIYINPLQQTDLEKLASGQKIESPPYRDFSRQK